MTDPSPSYKHPPVAEVALAVYFSPQVALRSVHAGRLWEKWRDRYPVTEDQPPLPPVMPETFPLKPSAPFQFVGGFPGTRVWYRSKSGDRLLQVQPDRFVLNWRRTPDDEAYPRYESLRPQFEQEVIEFLAFLVEEGLDEPSISQAEVSYNNPIPMTSLGEPLDLGSILAPWSGAFSDTFLPLPESGSVHLRFQIADPSTGEPVGRLYVDADPAIYQARPDQPLEEVFMLQVFARGFPLGGGLDGALHFLDLGHDWVVRGFTSLTTMSMHKRWGREE